jgi:hypothetical protein
LLFDTIRPLLLFDSLVVTVRGEDCQFFEFDAETKSLLVIFCLAVEYEFFNGVGIFEAEVYIFDGDAKIVDDARNKLLSEA